jgi:hypothetical protein
MPNSFTLASIAKPNRASAALGYAEPGRAMPRQPCHALQNHALPAMPCHAETR